MIEIRGKWNTAFCYADELEELAEGQIRSVCDQEAFRDCTIRIMPDVHAGKGCTIGTTMTIKGKIVPGMVGVDIGCGMETVRLKERGIDFSRLDSLIRRQIPSGQDVRKAPYAPGIIESLRELRCADQVKLDRAVHSVGTLGGGNHFIEIDCDDEGCLYLVVHSGSRHIGLEVAEYYQAQGRYAFWGGARYQLSAMIDELKAAGRHKEIEPMIQKMRKEHPIDIPKDLAYVEGRLFDDYIHDMKIIQGFAMENRRAMVQTIVKGLHLTPEEQFTTIHNYIETESMILRKGAVSARKGEKLLIPINMRDGSLICVGKGNPEWNCSAPHGAGRLMSRKAAMRSLSLEEYRSEMSGIFSTCVSEATLDEAPMAYKSMDDIVGQIGPTADILKRIKPVYNFKAAE
ncbi:MAG: RtcB family protein [Deltaproteobacteria bacterium]|nr:RtcB family protein [Deltaproteobacteria bacterium]